MVPSVAEIIARWEANPDLKGFWDELTELERKWMISIYKRHDSGILSAEGVSAEISAFLLQHLRKKYGVKS